MLGDVRLLQPKDGGQPDRWAGIAQGLAKGGQDQLRARPRLRLGRWSPERRVVRPPLAPPRWSAAGDPGQQANRSDPRLIRPSAIPGEVRQGRDQPLVVRLSQGQPDNLPDGGFRVP